MSRIVEFFNFAAFDPESPMVPFWSDYDAGELTLYGATEQPLFGLFPEYC